MKRLVLQIGFCLCVTYGATPVQAATVYWDNNGAVAGSGGSGAATTAWNTASVWSSDPAGGDGVTPVPGVWVAGSDAVFCAGTDGTGNHTLTPGAPVTANTITVDEGIVTMGGSSVTVGAITINTGAKFSISSTTQLLPTGTPNLTLNGGTLENRVVPAGSTFVNTGFVLVMGAGGGTLNCPGAANSRFNLPQIITGSGSFTLSGAGSAMGINGTSTYSGSTTINSPMELRLYGTNAKIPAGTDLIINGPSGVFNVSGSAQANPQTVASLSGSGIAAIGSTTLTINGSGSTTFSGVIQNSFTTYGATARTFGSLTKSGSGTLTLSGVNTYDGTFTLSSGTVTVDLGGTLAGPAVDAVVNGGTLNLNNTAQTVLSLASTASAGTVILASGHTLTVNNGTSKAYSGVIAGLGSVIKTAVGIWTLTGANTFSGGLALNDGRINFNNNAAGGAGTISVGSGADEFVSSVGSGTVTLTNSVVLNSGANPKIYATSGGTLELTGVISGPGGFLRDDTGGGNIKLSGDNTFEGGFKITSRTVRLNHPRALGMGVFTIGDAVTAPATAISLTADAILTGANAVTNAVTLNQSFTLAAVNDLELSGDVAIKPASAPTITVNSGKALTLSGDLSGVGSGFTKAGAGTLVLSGNNSYDTSTTVNAGTLLINGSIGNGGVVVASGGTLGGNGTISAALSVSGTVSPGTSVGVLTNVGAVTLNGGGTNTVEISDATGGTGSGWDLLSVTGGIDVQATSGSKFTIKLQTLSGASPGDAANFTSPAITGYSWPIASVTDAITNFAANAFAVNSSAFSNSVAGGHFIVDTNATQLLLVFVTNVPPVAMTDTNTRAPGIALKIPISTLLANDSDADSAFVTDTLSLVSVSSTSTNGASVSNDLTHVYYNPLNNVLDTFTYTIQDSFGHQATATVFVSVAASLAVPSPALLLSTNNTALVTFGGIPAYPYEVQRGTNVSFIGTTRQWTTNAPTQGLFTVEDDFLDIGGPPPEAYYRNRYAP